MRYEDLWIEARRVWDETIKLRGCVNIIIAGRSGVGKSTLINAVFQGDLADTGQGRPVTQETREFTKEDLPISIFDTRGLEMEKYRETIQGLVDLVVQRRKDPDPMRHIHAAWVCISEESRRVEEGESHLVERLSELGLPVILVITKARADRGFRQAAWDLCPAARQAVRVRGLAETDDEGHEYQVMGLETLVAATVEAVPEGVRNAFVAAQKVSLQLKRSRAHMVVASSATAAGTVGASPIPFADALLLIPLQVTMLAGITAVFGIPATEGFITGLVASVAGGAGATYAGRTLVSSLLKLVPGAGTAAGGVIAAGTAATLTAALGEAYLATLVFLFESNGRMPTPDEIQHAFSQRWKPGQAKRAAA